MEEAIAALINRWFFTLGSVIFHIVWFILWFAFHLDINLLTLIVSLEAIFITLFLGLGNKDHHEKLKSHISENDKLK